MFNKKKTSEIPVYLFLGFLESGKTTFIQETLEEDYFNDGQRTLIISCEEGLEEYDMELLSRTNSRLEYVDDPEELTPEALNAMILKHYPDRVIIEYNGMWTQEQLFDAMDETPLKLYQAIATADATTFDLYINNMRSLMVEMFRMAELVIINRCTKDSPRATWRRSIKAVNRRAQVVFDALNPMDLGEEEEELPFDISGETIQLEDEDFGIWFVDAMERPDVYDGKTIEMTARVYKSLRMPKGTFVPGRHAMTCCADDIQFIGYLCHTNHAKSSTIKSIKNKMWIHLTAEVKKEYNEAYKEEGPVLYAKRIEEAEQPVDELVYF